MRQVLWMAAILAAGAAASAQATPIGPDAYGYTATDQVTYAWQDIHTGSQASMTSDNPDLIPLGFDFKFYGQSYSSVYVTENGILTFGAGNSQSTNINLATTIPAYDGPTISPLWSDWARSGTGIAGAVCYKTTGSVGDRTAVIEWYQENHGGTSEGTVTFEAVLYEATGNILFQYDDVLASNAGGGPYDSGTGATIGIRDTGDPASGRYLQWSYSTNSIPPLYPVHDGEAILFTPIPEPVTMAGVLLAAGALAGYVRRRR